MRLALITLASGLALAGCNSTGTSTTADLAKLPTMTVSFKWCDPSPSFTVGNVPPGAKTLSFRMVDKQVPSYMHGGGSVAFTGKGSQTIPCGGLSGGNYRGPTPPPPQVHDYEWTVTALDTNGTLLAVGTATRKFPE